MTRRIEHLLMHPASQTGRLTCLLAIIGVVGLLGVWTNASAHLATGEASGIFSTAAGQAQSAEERIEPFLYNTAGWAVRGADVHLAIDRIPERKTAGGVGASPSAAVRTATGPIHRTCGPADDLERERSTLPLFQLHAALLI